MSFTRTAKAVVVSCSLAASEQVTVDLTVTFYQVQARVRKSQYGDDVYMVKVVKAEGINSATQKHSGADDRCKQLRLEDRKQNRTTNF